MGCNSHLFIELKRTYKTPEGEKSSWWLWAEVPESRDYNMYGSLAGVRTDYNEPVSPPRGIPEDLGYEVKEEFSKAGSDFHHHTWLTPDEFYEAINRTAIPRMNDDYAIKMYGKEGPFISKPWLAVRRTLHLLSELYGKDNVRIVIAFDN